MEPDTDGPVSLEILVKALAATAAVMVTSRFGPEWAAAGAVAGVLLPDGVRWVVRRRGWGRRRVAFLVGVVALFDRFDGAVGRLVRRALGAAGERLADGAMSALTSSQAAHTAATSAAALTLTAGVVGTVEALPTRQAEDAAGRSQSFELTTDRPATLEIEARGGDRLLVSLLDEDVERVSPVLRDIRIVLIDPEGLELDLGGVSPAFDAVEPEEPLAEPGTYRVRVDSNLGVRVPFTLTVFTAPDLPPLTVEPDGEGIPLTLSFSVPQRATVSFHADAGDRLLISLASTDIETSSVYRDINVALVAPDGSELKHTSVSSSFKAFEPAPLPERGTYELVIDPDGALAGNLTLRLALN